MSGMMTRLQIARRRASLEFQRPAGIRANQQRYRVCPHCKCLVDELTGCPWHGAVVPIWSAIKNEIGPETR